MSLVFIYIYAIHIIKFFHIFAIWAWSLEGPPLPSDTRTSGRRQTVWESSDTASVTRAVFQWVSWKHDLITNYISITKRGKKRQTKTRPVSQLEPNPRIGYQAREIRVSQGLKKYGVTFFSQSQNVKLLIQSLHGITFNTQLKTALRQKVHSTYHIWQPASERPSALKFLFNSEQIAALNLNAPLLKQKLSTRT